MPRSVGSGDRFPEQDRGEGDSWEHRLAGKDLEGPGGRPVTGWGGPGRGGGDRRRAPSQSAGEPQEPEARLYAARDTAPPRGPGAGAGGIQAAPSSLVPPHRAPVPAERTANVPARRGC